VHQSLLTVSHRRYYFSSAARLSCPSSFFFTLTSPSVIYPLSLHDALPILLRRLRQWRPPLCCPTRADKRQPVHRPPLLSSRLARSEEHTSELQSRENLVCRLLLEKKKK